MGPYEYWNNGTQNIVQYYQKAYREDYWADLTQTETFTLIDRRERFHEDNGQCSPYPGYQFTDDPDYIGPSYVV